MPETGQATAALSIRGEFTIFTAGELKQQLLDWIHNTPGPEIDIDLSEVCAIDTAGLQLMLMAKREASATGKRVLFARHSDEVLELINLCDLAGEFGDPLLIHPLGRDAS